MQRREGSGQRLSAYAYVAFVALVVGVGLAVVSVVWPDASWALETGTAFVVVGLVATAFERRPRATRGV